MKVLLLHQGAEMYGSDRVALNLAVHLHRRGHRVLVALPEEGACVAALRAQGVPVEIFPLPVLRRGTFKGLGPIRFTTSLIASYPGFSALAGRFNPDVLCTNTVTILTGGLWCRLKRRPHVWLVHEIFRGPGLEARLISRAVHLLADRVAVPSRAIAESLSSGCAAAGPKTVVIPNGIDPAAYAGRRGNIREKLPLDGGEILVGVAGRFNRWKGQREMVPAMAKAAMADPRLRFVFAGSAYRGDEPILADFEAGVAAAGLEKRIRILGEVADMGGFYADLDILVLPSIQPEPFGLVLLEAMAAGLPVVAFDQGGPREIVDPSCGLLVPPGDQHALAAAILALAADPGKRRAMGNSGSERVKRFYTIDIQGSAFEALLEDVIRR